MNDVIAILVILSFGFLVFHPYLVQQAWKNFDNEFLGIGGFIYWILSSLAIVALFVELLVNHVSFH